MWSLTVVKENLKQVLYFMEYDVLNNTRTVLNDNGYDCVEMFMGHPVNDPEHALLYLESGLNEFLYGENV